MVSIKDLMPLLKKKITGHPGIKLVLLHIKINLPTNDKYVWII